MANPLGDFDTSTVIYGKFTTFRPSTGAAYTLGGTPALSVYKDNSTTQSTTGVTLTADFDSVTGLNHFAIDTSADGTFYSAGSFFDIIITTGTVDGVSVVGACVGQFTLRKNSALKPTTAARTLDVSAGGEAGVDWANVGSPTTAVDLSGTTIKTATDVETDTQDIKSRLPAALTADGNIKADTLRVGGTLQTAKDLGAINVTNLNTLSGHDPGETIMGATDLDATLSAIAGYIDTEVAAIKAKTDNLPASPAAVGSAMTLTSGERDSIADALLDRDMSTGTDSGSATVRTVRQALRALRNKWSISAGTLTVTKEDDTTASWTSALTGDATADPIVESDPAGP